MKKKIICIGVTVVVLLIAVWSAMVITDYNRAKDMKPPLFAYSKHLDAHGGGIYDGIGYSVWARTKAFNGTDNVLYDMHFVMFGRGENYKFTIADRYNHHYLSICDSKKLVFDSIEALEYITPTKEGDEEIYSEHAHINGSNVILNLIFYKDVMIGFEYEYDNFEAAYEYATKLRQDLEMTFGEKTTYPETTQVNKGLFDKIKDESELKSDYTYYEFWTAGFDYNKKR